MLEYLRAERLYKIVKESKPYRGREFEEYPYWWNRDHGYKSFRPIYKKGEIEKYEIYYYSNKIAEVYPNNHIIFNSTYYGQGETMILRDLDKYAGMFKTEATRGGFIYEFEVGEMKYVIPLIKNVPYDMINNKIADWYRYDVVVKKVDRAKSSEFIKSYQDKINHFKVWFKALSMKDLYDNYLDIVAQYYPDIKKEWESQKQSQWFSGYYIPYNCGNNAYEAMKKANNGDNDYISYIILGALNDGKTDVSRYLRNELNINNWHAENFEKNKNYICDTFIKGFKESVWKLKDMYVEDRIPSELRYYPSCRHNISFDVQEVK